MGCRQGYLVVDWEDAEPARVVDLEVAESTTLGRCLWSQ